MFTIFMELVTFRNSLLSPGHFQVEFTCAIYFFNMNWKKSCSIQLHKCFPVATRFWNWQWICHQNINFLHRNVCIFMRHDCSGQHFLHWELQLHYAFFKQRKALFKNTLCNYCPVPLTIIIWEGNHLLLNANSLLATIIGRSFNNCFLFFHCLL